MKTTRCALTMLASFAPQSLVSQLPDTVWVEATGPGVSRPPLLPVVVKRIDTDAIGDGLGKIVLLVATPGGGIAIIDGQPAGPPLLVLDAEGRVVRRLGRYGEGPGEFSRSATVAVDRTGTVHVADGSLRRYTRWSADGRLIDSRAFGERVFPEGAGPGSLWLMAPHRYQLVCGNELSVSLPYSERRFPPATPRIPYGRERFRVPLSDARIVTVSSDLLGFSWWEANGTVIDPGANVKHPAPLTPTMMEWYPLDGASRRQRASGILFRPHGGSPDGRPPCRLVSAVLSRKVAPPDTDDGVRERLLREFEDGESALRYGGAACRFMSGKRGVIGPVPNACFLPKSPRSDGPDW